MEEKKRATSLIARGVRTLWQIKQSRIIGEYLTHYKDKALSAVENAMKCRGEE
jgi:hypothetical protein